MAFDPNQFVEDQEPSSFDVTEFLKDTALKGATGGEFVLGAGSGAVASIAAIPYGLGAAGYAAVKGENPAEAYVDASRELTEDLTYQPRGEWAKAGVEGLGELIEKGKHYSGALPENIGLWLNDNTGTNVDTNVLRGTGEAVFDTAMLAAPLAKPMGKIGKAKELKSPEVKFDPDQYIKEEITIEAPKEVIDYLDTPVEEITIKAVEDYKNQTAPELTNNASGESSASVEAINRLAQEKIKGQERFVINANTGEARPLITTDAVDFQPGKGEVVVQRNVGANEYTVLGKDPAIGNDFANGIIERFKQNKEAPKYQEVQKETPIYSLEKEAETAIIKNVPGIHEALKQFTPDTRPWEAVRTEILEKGVQASDIPWDSKVLPSRANLFSGKIGAQITQHPAMKWGIDVMSKSRREAEIAVDKALNGEGQTVGNRLTRKRTEDGATTVWKEKLSDVEKADLVKVFKDGEGVGYLTREELANRGFKDTQIKAYTAMTDQLKKAWDEFNKVRTELGEEPLQSRPGYFPSSWKGDFRVMVKDATTGEPIWVEGFNVKFNANRAKTRLQKKFPDTKIDIVERAKGSSEAADMAAFEEAMRIIGRKDPRIDAIKSALNEITTSNMKGFQQRLKPKKGVGGFLGDEGSLSSTRNAAKAMDSYEAYIRQIYGYIANQKTQAKLNQMLMDRELNMPKAKELIQEVFDYQRGLGENKLQVVDTLVEDMFKTFSGGQLGRSAPLEVVKGTKKAAMLSFLGFNRPSYLLTQIAQPFQFTIPHLVNLQAKGLNKGSAVKSALMGIKNIISISDDMKPARDWAIENKVVSPRFIEDVEYAGNWGKHKFKQGWDIVSGKYAIQKFEEYGRYNTFMSTVDFLKDNGIKGERLYETAADMTDTIMTSYAKEQRPLVYQKLGLIGEAASPLSTFKHNFYGQLNMFLQTAAHEKSIKGYAPLGTFLGMQVAFAGVAGLVLKEEADLLITAINKVFGTEIPTITEMIFKSKANDYIKFGAISGITGMNLSPSFASSAIVNTRGIGAQFPTLKYAADVAGDVGNLAYQSVKGTATDEDKAKALMAITPKAFAGASEYSLSENNMVPNPDKNMSGKYERNTKDWVAKGLGTTSIEESVANTASYQTQKKETQNYSKKERLLDQGVDKILKGESPDAEMLKALELGMTPVQFAQNLKERVKDRNTAQLSRQYGIAPHTLNQTLKYQEIQEYLDANKQ